MNVGIGGSDPSRKAAEEAARRAAEEAARRRAAEEAARKAAEEAARKAAEEAAKKAAEEAAKKAAEEAAKAKLAEQREMRLARYAPEETRAAAPKVEKKPEPQEEKGFFGKLWDDAKDAGNKVVDGAKKVGKAVDSELDDIGDKLADAGEAIASGAKKTVKAVDDGLDYVGEQIEAGARHVVDKVIDPLLDKSVLGDDDEYSGEKAGAVGNLLTNRLEPGESVFMKIEADAQFAGVQVGAGAQAEVKRVQKTDEAGNLVTEPKDDKGRPPTEIEVSLMVDANAGVGIQAELLNLQKGKAAGDRVVGADVSAGAEAQAGVSGQVEFKFRFDPNDPKAMEAMTGILKSASKSTLEATIPGIGMALAASNAPDVAKDAAAFASHLTEVRGEAGLYANATLEAGISLGAHEKADAAEEADGTEAKQGFKGMVVGQALDAAKLDVASLSAAIGGEVKLGANKDFRSDTTTLYLTINGQAQASGGVAGFEAGVGGTDSRTMAVTLDKKGEIVGASIQKTMTKEQFAGLGSEDLQGRRINSKALARLEEEDSVTVTYQMRPEALEAFKKQMKDAPASAVAGMIGQGYRLDQEKLEVASVTGSHVTSGELGFDVMGNQIKGTVGHGQEVALDPGDYGGKRLNSAMAEHSVIQRSPVGAGARTGR
ncbi:MAG TPA: hypothetical protein V6D00_14030 [Pantanalinema sp.]